jgi:hypothetical protein
MNKIQAILIEAKKRGITVYVEDGRLKSSHKPLPFVETIIQHHVEIKAWLNADHIAKQISLGEFEGCDAATVTALAKTLLAVKHPLVTRDETRIAKLTHKKP